jgi:hypothetical protein
MFVRNALILFGVVLVAAAVTPAVQAGQWDKKTVITINEPVQMPYCCNADHTVVLQPGTYVLALVDSLSDRHIVRVFEKDQKTVVTTILAIPNYRLQPTGNSTFQFWETPAGQPRAMRAWFYPGDNFGQEFAYHKTKSVEIARVAKAPVPTVVVETEAELKTAPVAIVDEKGEEAPLPAQTVVARNEPPVEPAPEPRATTPVSEAPATVSEAPAPATLPDTASPYPLFGLIGLGSVMASKVMSRLSKRT